MRRAWIIALCLTASACIADAEANDRARVRIRTFAGVAPAGNSHSFAPDGTNDFISVADSSAFDGDLDNKSVCIWARESTWAANDVFVGKYNTGNTQNAWVLRINNAAALKPQFCVMTTLTEVVCTNECTVTSNALSNGTAAFLCATYDGTQGTNTTKVHIYVNGTDTALTCVGTIPAAHQDATTVVSVGGNSTGSAAFGPGFLDEITYWSSTLTQANIDNLCCGHASCGGVCSYAGRQDSYGIPNLQLYLRIDGDTATYPTATDAAGGDNNGTYTNTVDNTVVSTTLP